MVLATIFNGEVQVDYASPDVNILIEGVFIGVDRGSLEVYDFNQLVKDGSLRNYMREVQTRRNQDKAEGLIGG